MRRLTAAAVLALAAVPVWTSGAAEPKLTSKNSMVAALPIKDGVNVNGTGCGVPASGTLTLPPGASDVQVQRPSVGARSNDARLTGVSVQGNTITLTAVADADCDYSWGGRFDVEATYKLRVGVVLVDHNPRGSLTTRPRAVYVTVFDAARGVRWQSFGGRKAVGFGRFKSYAGLPPSCRAGGCKTNDGTRLRVELTRPARCPGSRLRGHQEDTVFYGRIAFIVRGRLGVLKPGTEWISTKLECPGGGRPIPVR